MEPDSGEVRLAIRCARSRSAEVGFAIPRAGHSGRGIVQPLRRRAAAEEREDEQHPPSWNHLHASGSQCYLKPVGGSKVLGSSNGQILLLLLSCAASSG